MIGVIVLVISGLWVLAALWYFFSSKTFRILLVAGFVAFLFLKFGITQALMSWLSGAPWPPELTSVESNW